MSDVLTAQAIAAHTIRHFEGRLDRIEVDEISTAKVMHGGIGHVLLEHERDRWKLGDHIPDDQVEGWFATDLGKATRQVDALVDTHLTTPMRAALISWTFNLGPTNLASSTMLKFVNDPDRWSEVPRQIVRWNKSGGQVRAGLARRRAAEAALWNWGFALTQRWLEQQAAERSA